MVVPVVTGPGPLLVRAGDGADLALWRTERGTGARGHGGTVPVLLVHGTFSNRNFFGGRLGLAQYLADLGYDAWVAELRGRQPSAISHQPSAWTFEDWIIHDAPALLHAVRQATGSAKVLWIGHSAGAVIAVGCAARFADCAEMLAGIVMAAAPAPDRTGIFNVAVSLLGDAAGRIVGHFPSRRLNIGPVDEPPGVLKQWAAWGRTRRWTGRDGFDYLDGASRLTAPALALAGRRDVLAAPASCRRLLDALGSTDRAMLVFPGFTHNRLVISAAARQRVWPAIPAWMEQRFG